MPKGIPTSGRRAKGAGRKPLYSAPMVRLDIRVPVDDVEFLRTQGDGNLSAGVRRVVETVRATDESPPC